MNWHRDFNLWVDLEIPFRLVQSVNWSGVSDDLSVKWCLHTTIMVKPSATPLLYFWHSFSIGTEELETPNKFCWWKSSCLEWVVAGYHFQNMLVMSNSDFIEVWQVVAWDGFIVWISRPSSHIFLACQSHRTKWETTGVWTFRSTWFWLQRGKPTFADKGSKVAKHHVQFHLCLPYMTLWLSSYAGGRKCLVMANSWAISDRLTSSQSH